MTIEESKLRITVETDKAVKGSEKLDDSLGKLEKQGNKTSKSMMNQAKMIKGLVTGFAGFIILRKVAGWYKEATREADKKALATARLTSIAQTVTKANQEEIDSLRSLADQMQNNLAIGDDVVESGLSQILSYGATIEQTEMLALSLANLTAANKGVDATQEDAINSANMMGKALAGQAGALTKAGIIMDERQKKLIQEGNMATRVSTLIKVMEQNYGGLAKGLAETNAGLNKMEDNKIADISAEVGVKLLPAMLDVKRATVDWYTFVANNSDLIIRAVSATTTVISDAILVYDKWLNRDNPTFVEDMSEEIQFHQQKIGEAKKEIEGYQEAVTRLSAFMKRDGLSGEVIEQTVEKIERLNGKILEQEKNIDRGKKRIVAAGGAMKELSADNELFAGKIDKSASSVEALNDKLEKNAQLAKNSHEALVGLFGFDFGNATLTGVSIEEEVKDITDRYNNLWFSFDEGAKKANDYKQAVELLADAQKYLGITTEEADQILQSFVASQGKESAEALKKAMTEVDTARQTIVDSALQTGEVFANTMKDQLENGKADWSSFAVHVIGQIGKIITQILVLKAAQAGVSALGGGATPVPNANGNVIQGGVQPFANGGVVSSPTLFSFGNSSTGIMGEAGAEAILPLSRGSNGKLGVQSSGGGDVFHIDASTNVSGNADKSTVQELKALQQSTVKQVKQSILQDMNSGGTMSRTINRRS